MTASLPEPTEPQLSREPLVAGMAALHRGGWDGSRPALVVDGLNQRLYLLEQGRVAREWPVSTGAAGFGCREGSGCTPTGLHRVCAMIGGDAPPGAVFRAREFTGQVLEPGTPPPEGDYITSRILWLEGLEEGFNRGPGLDSRERYIYIHGTPWTEHLGRPASAGCVRMADAAVAELFQQLEEGALVQIVG